MNTRDDLNHAPSLRQLGLAAVLLAAASDALLLQHALGWNVTAFALLLVTALTLRFPVLRRSRSRHLTVGRVLCALLLASMLYRPTILNMLLATVGLVSLAIIARSGGGLPDIHSWWRSILLFIPAGWIGFWTDLGKARHLRRLRRRSVASASLPPPLPMQRANLASWAATLVFGVLFLTLFAVANPLLKRMLDDLAHWLLKLLLPTPARVAWWLAVLPLVWALFRFRTPRRFRRATEGAVKPALDPLAGIDRYLPTPRILTLSLALFNGIFLLQNLLDLTFLWGHAALPDGMTYAEYAHRGAYPLVATAALAGGFLLITFRGATGGRDYTAARRLVYLWVAQNVALTFSAAWRLRDYVSIYSLTRLRLSAVVWMVLVVGGLALICLRIMRRRSNSWLLASNTAMLLAVLYACCFVNTDAFIARFNVNRCRETTGQGQPLDTAYMRQLGDSAIPALRTLVAQEGVSLQDRRRIGALLTAAEYRLQAKIGDWRGWSYHRLRIVNAVQKKAQKKGGKS